MRPSNDNEGAGRLAQPEQKPEESPSNGSVVASGIATCEYCGEEFDGSRPNAGIASRDYHYECFNRAGYMDGESQARAVAFNDAVWSDGRMETAITALKTATEQLVTGKGWGLLGAVRSAGSRTRGRSIDLS